MPYNGPVPSPGCEHPAVPGVDWGKKPSDKWLFLKKTGPQIHKAAGGPDCFYIEPEYMIYAVRSASIPFPLLTAGPPTPPGIAPGVPGGDNVRVLVGDDNIHYGRELQAFRLTGGIWDSDRRCGLELSGFIQEHRGEFSNFALTSADHEALARPVIDALTGLTTTLLVSFPGAFSGEAHIDARIKMGGAEANALYSLLYCDRIKLNLLAGIRYLDLDESLNIVSRTVFPTGDITDVADEFSTRNQFLGGNFGFQSEFRRGRYFMDVTGKVGVGNVNNKLVVSGVTNTLVGGVGTSTEGGLLALGGNITNQSKNDFAYLPEVTVKLGYQWTQRISTYIGYNALYLSRVLRPGDQIDPVVNPVLVPTSGLFGGTFGPVTPVNNFNHTDFWAQGVTFGLSIRY
jgi:hypothetical protein